jgi:acetyltransferase-like isoleucine patch superfamily enzyme
MASPIEANRVHTVEPPAIGPNSSIQADHVVLGRNVRIGSNARIVCDRLELADGCSIGANATITCPEITLAESASVGKSLEAELNDYFRLGRHSSVGNRVKLAGRGVSAGEFLWMKNDVIVGGGGSQGPNSFLRIGDRTSIFDRSFINLSEEVTIGNGSALSFGVTILTHGAWQPALMGFTTKFGSVHLGHHSVIYLNAIVLPGVTIGDYSTIGAGAVVARNVPDHSLAMGNPATIVKSGPNYPVPLTHARMDQLLSSILSDYACTLEPKGIQVTAKPAPDHDTLVVNMNGRDYTIAYVRYGRGPRPQPDITVAFGDLPEGAAGKCHFNLKTLAVTGELTTLGEDLRDYLRRRAIRIFNGRPFRTIPLANLHRLRSRNLSGSAI